MSAGAAVRARAGSRRRPLGRPRRRAPHPRIGAGAGGWAWWGWGAPRGGRDVRSRCPRGAWRRAHRAARSHRTRAARGRGPIRAGRRGCQRRGSSGERGGTARRRPAHHLNEKKNGLGSAPSTATCSWTPRARPWRLTGCEGRPCDRARRGGGAARGVARDRVDAGGARGQVSNAVAASAGAGTARARARARSRTPAGQKGKKGVKAPARARARVGPAPARLRPLPPARRRGSERARSSGAGRRRAAGRAGARQLRVCRGGGARGGPGRTSLPAVCGAARAGARARSGNPRPAAAAAHRALHGTKCSAIQFKIYVK